MLNEYRDEPETYLTDISKDQAIQVLLQASVFIKYHLSGKIILNIPLRFIGKNHKKAMITLVERKHCFVIIEKVESTNSELAALKIIEIMSKYKSMVKPITFDNGLKFTGNETIAKRL